MTFSSTFDLFLINLHRHVAFLIFHKKHEKLIHQHPFSGKLLMKKSTFLPLLICCLLTHFTGIADELNLAENSLAGFCKKYPREEYKSLNRIPYNSDWFELYNIAPGIVAIYEPHQWQEIISYLIEGENKALLFDTGNGIGDIAAVVNQITDKPVIVVNSHSHYDHVGGNYAFDMILGMNTPFTINRQKGIKNKEIAIEVSQSALCRPTPNGVNESNHVGKPYSVNKIIEDGHKIELGNRTIEVIHIPGHTPDAIALIDRDAGLLWTGDSYYSGPIWLYAPETNLDLYRQSLQRLLKELPNVKALLPSHNTPWVEPEVLTSVLAGFDAMIRGELNNVSQGEGMVEFIVKGEHRFSFLMRDEVLPYK